MVQRIRTHEAAPCYSTERAVNLPVAYACVIESYDSCLLYPLLGDPIRAPGVPAKLDLLHGRDDSLIWTHAQHFLHLLTSWANGGPRHKPWRVRDTVRDPITDSDYAKWSRKPCLEARFGHSRRCGVEHKGYPVCLQLLTSFKHNTAEHRAG